MSARRCRLRRGRRRWSASGSGSALFFLFGREKREKKGEEKRRMRKKTIAAKEGTTFFLSLSLSFSLKKTPASRFSPSRSSPPASLGLLDRQRKKRILGEQASESEREAFDGGRQRKERQVFYGKPSLGVVLVLYFFAFRAATQQQATREALTWGASPPCQTS